MYLVEIISKQSTVLCEANMWNRLLEFVVLHVISHIFSILLFIFVHVPYLFNPPPPRILPFKILIFLSFQTFIILICSKTPFFMNFSMCGFPSSLQIFFLGFGYNTPTDMYLHYLVLVPLHALYKPVPRFLFKVSR